MYGFPPPFFILSILGPHYDSQEQTTGINLGLLTEKGYVVRILGRQLAEWIEGDADGSRAQISHREGAVRLECGCCPGCHWPLDPWTLNSIHSHPALRIPEDTTLVMKWNQKNFFFFLSLIQICVLNGVI